MNTIFDYQPINVGLNYEKIHLLPLPNDTLPLITLDNEIYETLTPILVNVEWILVLVFHMQKIYGMLKNPSEKDIPYTRPKLSKVLIRFILNLEIGFWIEF